MAEEQETPLPDDATAGEQGETVADDEATRAAASSGTDAEQTSEERAEPASPKDRRRRARAAKAAAQPPRPPRPAAERQAERAEERRRKARLRSTRRRREREKARSAGGSRREAAEIAPREHDAGKQKVRQGVVVSDRAAKTITVRIDIARRHPRYQKIVHTSRTLHAHDERDDANVGDTVVVRECRPLSATKRWRLVEVVARAQ